MTDENKDLEQEENLEIENEETQEETEGDVQDETNSDASTDSSTPDFEVEKAKSNGYLTKEQYVAKHGSDKGFKSPHDFNKFGELYPEIQSSLKSVNKKLEERDRQIAALVKYNEDVKNRERQAARRELEATLKEAKRLGDGDTVQQVVQRQNELNYQEAQEAAENAANTITRTQSDFVERNKDWYGVDEEMTNRAKQVDAEILAGNFAHIFPKPTTHEQLAKQIEVIVKGEFEKKRSQSSLTRSSGPNLNSSISNVNKSASPNNAAMNTFRSLSQDLKDVYVATVRTLKVSGYKYTEEEYINKLKNDGVL